MPLETATYVKDLVVTNPAASDGMNNADDHMRMIKSALKTTFPGASGVLMSPDGGFRALVDGAAASPAYSFSVEATLGFFRKSAGVIDVAGGRLAGQVPVGSIVDHAGAAAPAGYLPCDGQSVSKTTYPELFAAIGYTWGGSGDTFNVPSLANRYRRHRSDSSLAGPVGTLQDPAIQSHTHPVSGTTGNISNDHTHAFSGTTGQDYPDHTHSYTGQQFAAQGQVQPGGVGFTSNFSTSTGGASTRHQHNFSGTTGGVNSNHTHNFSVTSGATGDTETRPKSATLLACIRAF